MKKMQFKDYLIDNFMPYTIAILYAVIILVPMYFIFVSSFKQNTEIFTASLALPETWDLSNYMKLFSKDLAFNLGNATYNSIFITVSAEIVTLIFAFPAAFAIARIRTKLAPVVESIFGFGFLIPAFTVMLPIFLLMANFGLLYNPLALILFYPATRMPISVLILSGFLRQIPQDIEDSAVLDGASPLQMLRHIFFPLALPGVVTVVILNFITFWNEFLFALILLNNESRTIQIALSTLKGVRVVNYGMISAGV
ncbi:MAG TPA: carbohydrate ABC transporter permease, partial [Anaerolineaceae bacterium]|nr:carbohydrate ABC transporter permease [Anaerolineaceae bacterium]